MKEARASRIESTFKPQHRYSLKDPVWDDFLNDETVNAAQRLKNRTSRLHKFTRPATIGQTSIPHHYRSQVNAVDGSGQVSDDKVLSAENAIVNADADIFKKRYCDALSYQKHKKKKRKIQGVLQEHYDLAQMGSVRGYVAAKKAKGAAKSIKNGEEYSSDSSDEESSQAPVRTTAPKFKLRANSKAFVSRGSTFKILCLSSFRLFSAALLRSCSSSLSSFSFAYSMPRVMSGRVLFSLNDATGSGVCRAAFTKSPAFIKFSLRVPNLCVDFFSRRLLFVFLCCCLLYMTASCSRTRFRIASPVRFMSLQPFSIPEPSKLYLTSAMSRFDFKRFQLLSLDAECSIVRFNGPMLILPAPGVAGRKAESALEASTVGRWNSSVFNMESSCNFSRTTERNFCFGSEHPGPRDDKIVARSEMTFFLLSLQLIRFQVRVQQLEGLLKLVYL